MTGMMRQRRSASVIMDCTVIFILSMANDKIEEVGFERI
jgi:hypothetical protein